MMGFGFSLFDSLFPFFFTCIFLLVIGTFIYVFVSNIGEWNKNNHSPKLRVPAIVVDKHGTVSHHHDANHMDHTSTTHYVTFQVESGDRMQFIINSQEYGMLVVGDKGWLEFQGTRYLGFERLQ